MTLPAVFKSKIPTVDDARWSEMVWAKILLYPVWTLTEARLNPFVLAEAAVVGDLTGVAPEEDLRLKRISDPEAYAHPTLRPDEIFAVRKAWAKYGDSFVVADMIGVDETEVVPIAQGKISPCAGGPLTKPEKGGFSLSDEDTPARRGFCRGLLVQASSIFCPEDFEVLCHQNGITTADAFESIATEGPRNDEYDQLRHRSILRAIQKSNPEEA